jgi:hypothetical protein
MNYRISDLKIVEGLKTLKGRLQEKRRRARLNWADVFEFMLIASWHYLDKPQPETPPTERGPASTPTSVPIPAREAMAVAAPKSPPSAPKGVSLPSAQDLDF